MEESVESLKSLAKVESDMGLVSFEVAGKEGDGPVASDDLKEETDSEPVLFSRGAECVKALEAAPPVKERDGLKDGKGGIRRGRKRGRKKRRVDSDECDGGDRLGITKVKDEDDGSVVFKEKRAKRGEKKPIADGTGYIGRVLRPRAAAKGASDKGRGYGEGKQGKVEKAEILPSGKLKRKRGRPPKNPLLPGYRGVVGVTAGNEAVMELSRKRKRGRQAAVGVEVHKTSKSAVHLEKKLAGKMSRLKRKGSNKRNILGDLKTDGDETSSGLQSELVKTSTVKKRHLNAAKQLIRARIIDLLLGAGWKIEHRPRSSKEYSDSVYISPDGRGYWSVTLAYSVLKKQYEDGVSDSNAHFSFTPIPDEEIQKLSRKTVKKMEREKQKMKQQAKGGGNTGEECLGRKSKKKKQAGDRVERHEEKSSGIARSGHKLLKGGAENSLLGEQDYIINSLQNAEPKMAGRQKSLQKTQNRKRCALLVRNSRKEGNSELDDDIPYCGKRSVLAWMIDLDVVPLNGKVLYMNQRRTRAMLEGTITRDGIHCRCCGETLTISKFEVHAGSKLCKASQNICLETGTSLLQCQLDSWNKQDESERNGFHLLEVNGDDPNDDTCGICGDGGDLVCCDGCPSTFHQSCLDIQDFPSGDWHCVHCSCRICGMIGSGSSERVNDVTVSELLTCHLCEEKYHQSCLLSVDARCDGSDRLSFCGSRCQELFEKLQELLGVKHDLEEGYSLTFIRRSEVSKNASLNEVCQKVESNSKLAVALSVMDECFLPLVDERSGINLIRNILYNCGSNITRLNYTGFITAVLERDDEIVCAASIRIHGNFLAEMPFIGTRHMYRRQGMCRRLLNGIESVLCTLKVENLVIPAISELLQTWTSVFGFQPLDIANRKKIKLLNMLVFPGTDMLQKPLLKHHHDDQNNIPSSEADGMIIASDGPSSLISSEDVVQHNDKHCADSSLHLPDGLSHDTSNITSETINVSESSDVNCRLIDVEAMNNTATNSHGSPHDAHNADSQSAPEESNNCNINASIAINSERNINGTRTEVISCGEKREFSIVNGNLNSQGGHLVHRIAESDIGRASDSIACHHLKSTSCMCNDGKCDCQSCGTTCNCSFANPNGHKSCVYNPEFGVRKVIDAEDGMLGIRAVKDADVSQKHSHVKVDEESTGNAGSEILSTTCSSSCDATVRSTFPSAHGTAQDVPNGSHAAFLNERDPNSLTQTDIAHSCVEVAASVTNEDYFISAASSVEPSHQSVNVVTVDDVHGRSDANIPLTNSHMIDDDCPPGGLQMNNNSLERSGSVSVILNPLAT